MTETEYKINQDAIKNSSTNIIPAGNIIISTRVGLGKVCLLKNDTAINQDLKGIIPKDKNKLSADYLLNWFKSICNKIIEEGTGATVQGVKLPFIKSLIIPLPSIDDQQIIVHKINSLLIRMNEFEAIYSKKIENLEELKKCILQKAFKGELN